MCKLLAVFATDVNVGFELAGIETLRVQDADEARDVVRTAADSEEYGIIILDEGLLEEFDEKTRKWCADTRNPLIVTVPGSMRWRDVEERAADDYATNLIRRAVGYQVNIQL